ncbi:MAG: TolC family protein [Bacteroidales bacterium]|nr:TolC family protein [Bacteroidales bacterium]
MMKRLSFILLIFIPMLMISVKGKGQQVLRFQDAISVAAKHSPDIKRVQLNMDRSQELLKAQKASLKSNFSFNVNPLKYSHDRGFNEYYNEWYTKDNLSSSGALTVSQPLIWTDGNISISNQLRWQNSYSEINDARNKTFTNNLFLRYDQPLFTYNRTRQVLQELELDLENAELSFAMQMLNLERMVAQGFYSVHQQQMSLQITEEEYANQVESFNIIKNKVEGGLAALEELYQAELNLAKSNSSLKNAIVSLENAKDQFKVQIGMDIYEELAVLANVQTDSVPIDLKKSIEMGLANRLELRQREIDIQNAQFSLIQTKSINEFRGNLSVEVGLFGDNKNLPNIYDSPTDNEQLALSLQIPIFDWGERKARIAAAEISIKSSELSLADERNDIIIGIREVYRNLQNLLIQIDISHQSERNAQLTYEINYERYKNGDLTGMDLSLYQNQLSQSKIDLSNAMINYKLELLNMKIQTLYDWETQTSVVPEEIKNK